jgi:hypothetical protein
MKRFPPNGPGRLRPAIAFLAAAGARTGVTDTRGRQVLHLLLADAQPDATAGAGHVPCEKQPITQRLITGADYPASSVLRGMKRLVNGAYCGLSVKLAVDGGKT